MYNQIFKHSKLIGKSCKTDIDNEHDSFSVGNSCYRLECPIDYESSAMREGFAVEERPLGSIQNWTESLLLTGKKSDFNLLRRKAYATEGIFKG